MLTQRWLLVGVMSLGLSQSWGERDVEARGMNKYKMGDPI